MKKTRKPVSTANKIILIYLAVQFLPLLVVPLFPEEQQIEMSLSISLLFALAGTVVMTGMNLRTKDWTPHSSLTEEPSAPLGKVILYGVLGFVGAILVQIVTAIVESALFGIPPASENTEMILGLTSNYPLLIFSIVLFAPIMEELVFRKAIVTQVVDHIGFVGAACVSSLIFAFFHFDGHLLRYAALGLWFCYLYFKTNNILAPMLAHGIMNGFASLPLLFPEMLQ